MHFANFMISVLLLIYATNSNAEDHQRKNGDMELNLWGASYHLEKAPVFRTWNERNPGIGLRRYFGKISSAEMFLTADYIDKNSTGGSYMQAGVGIQFPVYRIREVSLLVGAVAGVGRYENSWQHQNHIFLGAYPFVAIRKNDITLSIGYIPKVRVGAVETFPSIFGNASLKF